MSIALLVIHEKHIVFKIKNHLYAISQLNLKVMLSVREVCWRWVADLGGVDLDPVLHTKTGSGSRSWSYRQEKPHLIFKTRPYSSFKKTWIWTNKTGSVLQNKTGSGSDPQNINSQLKVGKYNKNMILTHYTLHINSCI